MSEQLFSVDGYCYVVSGASSGLGRAMAGFLCAAGAQVIGIARRTQALDELAHELAHCAGEFQGVSADLQQLTNVDEVAAACLACFGRVDGVINAAGVNLRQPVDDISIESWQQTLDLNLAAPFFLTRSLIAGMRERGFGRVINIASLQSSRAFPNGLAYGASKGGVCQLTRAMAEAWSGDGICCNAIAPGFFPTELTAAVFNNADTAQWASKQTTMGRNGQLQDLQGPTLFLASQASGYITGQTIHVDGGFTAK